MLSYRVVNFKGLLHQGSELKRCHSGNPSPKQLNVPPYRDIKTKNDCLSTSFVHTVCIYVQLLAFSLPAISSFEESDLWSVSLQALLNSLCPSQRECSAHRHLYSLGRQTLYLTMRVLCVFLASLPRLGYCFYFPSPLFSLPWLPTKLQYCYLLLLLIFPSLPALL